jgi:hypothetical protein
MGSFDPAYLAQMNSLPGNEVLGGPAADQTPPVNLAQLNAEEAAVRAGGPLPQSPTSALPRASGRGLPPPTDKAKLEQSVATGKEMGTETGKAIMALPVAEATVDRAIGHLDELAKDPMSAKVGTPGYAARKLPSALGVGTSESDFAARVKQASGDMMRSAYDAIRGTGPITDKEMEPLIAAMTRVSDARTPKGFQDAIKDAKAALKMTLELAKKKARVTTTDDLVKKYGS